MPILLMGHQDVVPADDEGWSVPAYSGQVVDGKLYGRGALDCKSTMVMGFQTVEELLAAQFIPSCDVWLEYFINEASGGDGAPVSDIHSPQYAYLVDCIKNQFPDIGISTYLIMVGTGFRCFHELTDNALHFAPMRLTTLKNAACHAVDENVTLSVLAKSVAFFKEFLKGYNL